MTDAASGFLAGRIGRRTLLSRAAMAGSALTVAPKDFLLKPVSAYGAICTCAGGTSCDCGAACCDGYTEFCCNITGANSCPPGAVIAGWWKADGSGLCVDSGVDRPRYYMDCNAAAAGPCGPGGVTTATTQCSCGCRDGSCNNRRQCCVAFRYGQCHNEIPCLGPIVCRVVSCTPPWQLEPTCSTVVATDNFTRFQTAPCLAPPPPPPPSGSLPLVAGNGAWYRSWSRRSNDFGGQQPFAYGSPGDTVLSGDWNGDGVWSPGVVIGNVWHLRNTNSTGYGDVAFVYGDPGDTKFVGDWTGSGRMTPGVVRGNVWHLRNSNTSGDADISFVYGDPGDVKLVGDWTGSGVFTPGVVKDGNRWFLRTRNSSGYSDIYFQYGDPGDIPIVGDWNNDGIMSPGVIRGNRWLLRNSNTSGDHEIELVFDAPVPAAQRRHLVWQARRLRS
jgi:hypothetical protein